MTTPEPHPIEPTATGPACELCGGPAVVHWQRRLTDDEYDAYLAIHQAKRDEQLLLGDPQGAAPTPEPLPLPADCTRAVHGCVNHAIGINAAAHVHAKTCTAPQVDDLPGCDCSPEPLPKPAPEPEPAQLPASWAAPA
ncbi:hypothetical protein OS965_02495 [Streptomyces sp. H27-G5]|uniref:hypothetical protein n=1 Tax=Streptomyces sp. H27-G5 TaxID=2996698 RepID=UPI00227217E9|nr:hypothetical protein [Streptomyces sp. H27-G5]MCY0917046.1 hypothetical protein [Streptomyces sp. H27-G5]